MKDARRQQQLTRAAIKYKQGIFDANYFTSRPCLRQFYGGAMSTIIMNECWPIQGMNATQKAVLISLADNANDEGYCWPSVDTIAMRTCLSARSVQTAIKWLREHGALQILERAGRSHVYLLTPTKFSPLRDLHPAKNVDTPANNVETPAGFAYPPAGAAPITTNNHHRTTKEPPKDTHVS